MSLSEQIDQQRQAMHQPQTAMSGLAAAAAAAPQQSTATTAFLERVRRSNIRIEELISCQLDQISRLTGNNPIQVNSTSDRVQSEGIHSEFIQALDVTEMLIDQLNQLTDAWGSV